MEPGLTPQSDRAFTQRASIRMTKIRNCARAYRLVVGVVRGVYSVFARGRLGRRQKRRTVEKKGRISGLDNEPLQLAVLLKRAVVGKTQAYGQTFSQRPDSERPF